MDDFTEKYMNALNEKKPVHKLMFLLPSIGLAIGGVIMIIAVIIMIFLFSKSYGFWFFCFILTLIPTVFYWCYVVFIEVLETGNNNNGWEVKKEKKHLLFPENSEESMRSFFMLSAGLTFITGVGIYFFSLGFYAIGSLWDYLYGVAFFISISLFLGTMIFIFLKSEKKSEEKEKLVESKRPVKSIATTYKNDVIDINERQFHRIDKIIAETNDRFNANLNKKYSKQFIQAWVKYRLGELRINKMAQDLHSDNFNKLQAQSLIGHCEFVVHAIFEEWYKGYNPSISFSAIKQKAESEVEDRYNSISDLESYLFYLIKSLTDSIEISERTRNEMNLVDRDIESIRYYLDRRTTKDNILQRKLSFLLISVFFKDREGVSIKGRDKSRTASLEGIVNDINQVKESIVNHEKFYPSIKNAYMKNKVVKQWLEEEMGQMNSSDKDYIEQCNKLIERAKGELNYDFI